MLFREDLMGRLSLQYIIQGSHLLEGLIWGKGVAKVRQTTVMAAVMLGPGPTVFDMALGRLRQPLGASMKGIGRMTDRTAMER